LKKEEKTVNDAAGRRLKWVIRVPVVTDKSFLVLFFKKEHSSFHASRRVAAEVV
jgi:hypothetical protein